MQTTISRVAEAVGGILLGKDKQIKLALACLFARGHLLIEDLPGMGKTTLAHGLAVALGLSYDRIQFTSDLLPADILGVAVFDRNNSNFKFHPGPVFTQILLADEINRSTPKTQSALLEAMEEGQVTVEGESRSLPQPFFVIATQNPLSQAGTFPLPESQLDRFLMRITLGYPSQASERQLFQGVDPRQRLRDMESVMTEKDLVAVQDQVNQVKATDQLLDYLQRLVEYTRSDGRFALGLSPRGALALLRAAKAWALIHQRDYVVPEDVQAVLPAVVAHRVRGDQASVAAGDNSESLAEYLLKNVDVVV